MSYTHLPTHISTHSPTPNTYIPPLLSPSPSFQAAEYQTLVVREQELLRSLSPLLMSDAGAAGPLREARRLRQAKAKAVAKLEQAIGARRLLQEAGRHLRHVRRVLEWARPRLAWIQSMHSAGERHGMEGLSSGMGWWWWGVQEADEYMNEYMNEYRNEYRNMVSTGIPPVQTKHFAYLARPLSCISWTTHRGSARIHNQPPTL